MEHLGTVVWGPEPSTNHAVIQFQSCGHSKCFVGDLMLLYSPCLVLATFVYLRIHGQCETLNKTQGNEYEETHPTKICISFGSGISIPVLRTICQRFLSWSAVCVACSSCKLGRTWINRQNPTSNLTSLKPERPKVVCPRP